MAGDIILKKFDNLVSQESYGGKTLIENFNNADKAIAKVQYTERIWDRNRSQWMLKFLACSQQDTWMRIRQVSAEMSDRRRALYENKFGYMKKMTEAKIKREKILELEEGHETDLLEIEASELEWQANDMMALVEGCLKEIETLGDLHDQLKQKLGGDITEEEYERVQTRCHIKRAISQAIWDVRENGVIKGGNQEYLTQCGCSVANALKEIIGFLEDEIKTEVTSTESLNKFIDDFANRHQEVSVQQADWLGFDPNARIDFTY
jgi:hypothetical protein